MLGRETDEPKHEGLSWPCRRGGAFLDSGFRDGRIVEVLGSASCGWNRALIEEVG